MPVLTFDVTFPLPAARLEVSLGLRDEPVAMREYALVIEVADPAGGVFPKGLLNWGYSAPLQGSYQYVPEAPAKGVASIPLPILTERPIGALTARVVPWKLQGSSADPSAAFDRLLVSYSAAESVGAPRFVTVRRNSRG